ncbi:DUF4105 domain-containing protein [Luteimonas sp. BDR2-5]|uniref:Lnb N-terminal periplasmic domain-containing protein n=1 Tax=Proluteimonas luteida TaxID=2878685 RepID=UPI001E3A4AF8|nr:DUF4105 domain-containing protein [Luteimonas sp. BDR2-5]MCD9029037.1 DUF4105 domain-containing protein [Luteimonas sp. BDR2-5]
MSRTTSWPRRCARAFAALALLGLTAWGALALWYQGPAATPLRVALIAGWSLAGIAAAVGLMRARRRATLLAFGAAAVALLGWWSTLAPSHDRDWADDVARLLEADVDGSRVTLRNVRNFHWRSETDYDIRWETRSYDLDRLATADLVMSYWMGPQIAHTLVSFGFDDGQRVVFSIEIRKERDEHFSAIGGFFREFEAVLIAADERDIIRTRSNARGEQVYLYALDLDRAHLRALFLGYVGEADDLLRAPRFYNSLTSNCTTVIYDIARHVAPGLPLDYRLLLSGYFAEYVYDLGGLAPGYGYPQLRARGHINARARAADARGEDFSRAIRAGLPGVAPSPPVAAARDLDPRQEAE